MENKVYVVAVYEEERVYNAEQSSNFPQFYPVMGVFRSHSSAHGYVYEYFCETFAGCYEELEAHGDHYVYRYEDKRNGGYALYNVRVCEKEIRE